MAPRGFPEPEVIVYESEPPSVRAGEQDVAGRRIAVRAIPYSGDIGPPPFRFDPVDRRFVARRTDGTVLAGPPVADAWREAIARGPAGPALVGPAEGSHEIWGSYLAAAEGAAAAGRAVYLLDPPAAGLPVPSAGEFVALFLWIPEDEFPAGLAAARSRKIPAGCLLPLLPGWTASADVVREAVKRAAAAGAGFLAPLFPSEQGDARRSIVEAAGALGKKELPEDLFDRIHHGDWSACLGSVAEILTDECSRAGLSAIPPRPVGLAEPPGNAAAARRLEEAAQALWKDEHRATLLRGAARWIDECGRDLAPIAREGNFRKVFPLGNDLAGDAEKALLGVIP